MNNPNDGAKPGLLNVVRLVVAAGIAALVVLPLLLEPLRLDYAEGEARIHFEAGRRWVLLPGDCVAVRWQAEGVQEIALDGEGVTGAGERAICLERGEAPELRVVLANGQSRTYRLPVGIAALSAELWMALGAAALAVVLALRAGYVSSLAGRWRQIAAALLLIGAAGMAAVFALLGSGPDTLHARIGDSRIEFRVDDLPGGCTRAQWSVEGVRGLYLNNEGVPGTGERENCPAPGDRRFGETLRVDLPDGSSRTYTLDRRVDRYALLALALGMLLLAGRLTPVPPITALGNDLARGGARLLGSLRRLSLSGHGEDGARPGDLDGRWADLAALILLAAAVLVVFGNVIGAQTVVHDFALHVEFARQIYRTGSLDPSTPGADTDLVPAGDVRFLYQALVIAAYSLIPRIDFMTAGLLVIVIGFAALALLLYAGVSAVFMRAAPGRRLTFPAALASAGVAFGLMLVAPVNLLTAAQNAFYFTYLPITVYQSPTVIVLKPLAVLVFWYAARAVAPALDPRPLPLSGAGFLRDDTFSPPLQTPPPGPLPVHREGEPVGRGHSEPTSPLRKRRGGRRVRFRARANGPFVKNLPLTGPLLPQKEGEHRRSPSVGATLIAGALVILSLLLKPSYLICLLPALALIVLDRLRRREGVHWPLLLGIVLPAVAVLGLQFAATYARPDQGSILFAPFVVRDAHAARATALPGFALSILFPLAVYGLYFREARKNTALTLAWLAFLAGAFYTYFLAESGYTLTHWNFGWSGQVTLFVLFVASAQALIGQAPGSAAGKIGPLSGRFLLCVVAFGLHLVSGAIWYAFNLSPEATFWWMYPEF